MQVPKLHLMIALLLQMLVCCPSLSVAREPVAALTDEPLLRELFSGEPSLPEKLSSCLDSVFNLKRAYEVLYSVKSIYNGFLTNRTDQLTEAERKLLLFCQESLPIGPEAVGEYFKHPVNAHKFVIYVVREMNPKLRELSVEHSAVKILLRHLISNAGCWLCEGSVSESIDSLLTVGQFYNVSVENFAAGNLAGQRSVLAFTAAELLEILLHMNRQSDPIQIAEMADFLRRERLEEMRGLGEQPVRSMYRILGKAYYQTRQFDKAIEALREYQARAAAQSESSNRGVASDLAYVEANRRGEPVDLAAEAERAIASGLEREFDAGATADTRAAFRRYHRLCGFGEYDDEVAASASSANPLLICELWRPHNGWYPIRKEILSVAPLVVRYKDVFAHKRNLTDALMMEAEKRIYEAPKEDISAAAKRSRLTQIRIHAFSQPLLPFNSNETLAIIRLIEFTTGMDVSVHFASKEKYIEVSNQGHGARNRPHIPAQLPSLFYDGMATAVFFPVEGVIGGEEIFPGKGLKIPVKQSDLVVWYNYLPSYNLDRTAHHIGCPVLFGDKWSAKVTLGLTRCSLDQDAMLETWLPGLTQARRRAYAKSWKVLSKPAKLQSDLQLTKNETVANATVTELQETVQPSGDNSTDDQFKRQFKINTTDDNSTLVSDEAVETVDAADIDEEDEQD